MAAIGEYPVYEKVEDLPYYKTIESRLRHAKEYAPHKVAYYEEILRQWREHSPKTNQPTP